MNERQKLVAKAQDRCVLDALDTMLLSRPHANKFPSLRPEAWPKRSPAASTINTRHDCQSERNLDREVPKPCPGTDFASIVPPI